MGVQKISEINNGKSAIRFALPTIIMTVFVATYSMVDGFFISHFVGTDAVGATNILLPIICLATATGFMFSSGGTAWVGKKLGMGKINEARSDASLIILVAFVISSVISVSCILCMDRLVSFLGADEVLFGYAYEYGIAITAFFPLLVMQTVLGQFVIASGKPIHSMVSFIIGGVTNILLDYVFIVHFGMGVTGAALATGIGAPLPVMAGLYLLSRKDCDLRLTKPSKNICVLFGSCSNGASEMVSELSIAVTSMLFNITMMQCAGADGVAAISVILYVQTFAVSAVVGYTTGTSAIVAYNYGAGNKKCLNMMFRNGLCISALISSVFFTVLFVCGSDLAVLFAGDSPIVRDMIEEGTFIFSFGFLMAGFNIFTSGFFTSLSDGKSSAIVSAFRGILILAPSIILLSSMFGTTGIWFSVPITELTTLCVSVCLLIRKMPGYGIAVCRGIKNRTTEVLDNM